MTTELNRDFFSRPARILAPEILGCELCTCQGGVETAGRIVEVEAYGGPKDTACHAFRGATKRNLVMFKQGGYCYVYFIYGMHYCVNVVAGPEGEGEAVLIRAVEPTKGIEIMRQRRKLGSAKGDNLLTNGPGKVCQALAIDTQMLGEDLLTSRQIYLKRSGGDCSKFITHSKRIGISSAKGLPWRYYLRGNRWVSKA